MSNQSIFIIAEAGVNHNGSVDMALQLVDEAAKAGADAVKFQTFKSEAVISRFAVKAEYQKQTTGEEDTQLEMVRRLELDVLAHKRIRDRCLQRNIQFLSTPFDLGSLHLLINEFDLPIIKIPSGEITNAPFLIEIAKTGKELILSTGMSTLGEIETALGILAFGALMSDAKPSQDSFRQAYESDAGQSVLKERITLLHCTTEYPAPLDQVNLMAIDTMRQAFGLPVGYSDHTEGIAVSIAAVALGACVIEKHFTLDRNLPGPDHQASLEPRELFELVKGIRAIELAKGSAKKIAVASERANRTVARKSLVALTQVKKGESFTLDNLGCKRPGHGISPLNYWNVLGTISDRDYAEDETISTSVKF
ncbi:MAG: N-acetylneuraminate synthase [Methylophilaceae bacterium]